MRKRLIIIFVVYSGFCFSQTRDTILTETEPLSKDKAFEMSISMISPGVSFFNSEIKNHLNGNNYFNMIHIGLAFKNISTNFLVNIKGMNVTDSLSFNNQYWTKGMELTHYSLGVNLSYRFQLTSKLSLKPFAGVSSSSYYLVKHDENDPTQKSITSFCGQYGVNAEYRFKPKRNYSLVEDNGDIQWGDQYWSIQLQTGIFPSLFRGNTGLKGNLLYFAIGGSFNVGTYTHHRK